MKKCQSCSCENSDDSKFCRGCGKSFVARPRIQKWEYYAKSESVLNKKSRFSSPELGVGLPWTQKDENGKMAGDSMNELGNIGWELVSVTPIASVIGVTLMQELQLICFLRINDQLRGELYFLSTLYPHIIKSVHIKLEKNI